MNIKPSDFPRKSFHFKQAVKTNFKEQVKKDPRFVAVPANNCHKLSFDSIKKMVCEMVNDGKNLEEELSCTTDDKTRLKILKFINESTSAETKKEKIEKAKKAIQLWNNSEKNLRPGYQHVNKSIQQYLDLHTIATANGISATPFSKKLLRQGQVPKTIVINATSFFKTSDFKSPIPLNKGSPETQAIIKETMNSDPTSKRKLVFKR